MTTKYTYSVAFTSPWWFATAPVLTCGLAVWSGAMAMKRISQFREQSAIAIGIVFVVLILVKFLLNSLSNRQYAETHNASAPTQKAFGETAYLLYAVVNAFGIVLAGLFHSL